MKLAKKTSALVLTHFVISLSVTWAITGSLTLGGLVAVVEPLVNTAAFLIHERFSSRIA